MNPKVPALTRAINLLIDLSVIILCIIIARQYYVVNKLEAYLGFFAYYFILESFSGKTIGKLITKTMVVNKDGSKATAWKVSLRTIIRIIPLEPIPFLWGANPHDDGSGTIVISATVDYKSSLNEDIHAVKNAMVKSNRLMVGGLFLLLIIAHIFILSNKAYTIPGMISFKDAQQYQEFLQGFGSQSQLAYSQYTQITYAGLPDWAPNIFFIAYLVLAIFFIKKEYEKVTL